MINAVHGLLRNLCDEGITSGTNVFSDITELMPSVRRMEIAFP